MTRKTPTLRGPWRDSARLAVQSAAAAAATWFVMERLGLPHTSWAVISALFVVQPSLDGAFTAALGRIAGTVVGTIVGLATVILFGGGDLTALRLALAALGVYAAVQFWPNMSYGLVAASVIALEADPQVIGGAAERALAIILGAGTGALATVLVWPDSARARADRSLRQALAACRDLLEESLREALGEARQDRAAARDRFLGQLREARQAAASIRLGRRKRPSPTEAVEGLERLWHAMVLIERALERRPARGLTARSTLGRSVDEARRAACAYLSAIEAQGSGDAAWAPAGRLRAAVDEAQETARQTAERTPGEAAAVGALVFGLGEVGRSLDALQPVWTRGSGSGLVDGVGLQDGRALRRQILARLGKRERA